MRHEREEKLGEKDIFCDNAFILLGNRKAMYGEVGESTEDNVVIFYDSKKDIFSAVDVLAEYEVRGGIYIYGY